MIEWSYREENRELFLSAKGHANYAAHGADILCAAVSVLFYSLQTSLRKYKKAALDPGNAAVIAKATKKNRILFSMVKNGLFLLSEAYPSHVREAPLPPRTGSTQSY